MKFIVVLISLLFMGFGFSQTTPREYLCEKADSLELLKEFSQARYYYLLSLKQEGELPTDDMIKQKVVHLDSSLAYASSNLAFIDVITKADKLLAEEKYIEAMKFFDDASTLEPSFDYPRARIDYIIETSKEIKKQLLIYNAKQNQLSYSKLLDDIEQLEKDGFAIEAFIQYRNFAKVYHGDSLANSRAEILYEKNVDLIGKYSSLVVEGEEHYLGGRFEKAQENYEGALSVNPKCQTCPFRLEQIEYCLKQQLDQSKDFDKNLSAAKDDFKKGLYEKAYYQFSWLQKQQPENVEIRSYVKKLEELIEAETDDRMKKFNADLTLEKANNAFLSQSYEDALSGYLKLKNAYSDVIDYLQFVELRIGECLSELDQ